MLDEFMLAWSGVEKSARTDIQGTYMELIWKNLIKNIQDINERCLRLDLTIYGRNVTFLAVYTPTLLPKQ